MSQFSSESSVDLFKANSIPREQKKKEKEADRRFFSTLKNIFRTWAGDFGKRLARREPKAIVNQA